MASSTRSTVIATILILITACSYAVLSTIGTISNLDLSALLVGQFFYGWVILGIIALIVWLVWQRKQPKSAKNPNKMPKRVILLIITGIICALVTVLYFQSFITYEVPVSLAVILLFQYAWIGVVIEAIVRRKVPSKGKIIAALVIIAGTILAGGIIGTDLSLLAMNPLGILCGLGAALCYALFFHLSGTIETQMPSLHKSFLISTVALVFVIIFVAATMGGFATVGAVFVDVEALKYIIPLGFFGIALPIFLLSLGAPKLSTGMVSILNSAELPVEVLLAALVLGDTVGALRWVGVGIIILGIALPYIIERKMISGLED